MFSRTISHISRPDSDALSRTRRGVPLRWQPGPRRRRTEAHCVHRQCCSSGSNRLLSAWQGTVKVTASGRWKNITLATVTQLRFTRPHSCAANVLKARFTFRRSSCEEVHVTPTAPEVWFSFCFSLPPPFPVATSSFSFICPSVFFFVVPALDTFRLPSVELILDALITKGPSRDVQRPEWPCGRLRAPAPCTLCGVHCFSAALTSFWHPYTAKKREREKGWSCYHWAGGTQDK